MFGTGRKRPVLAAVLALVYPGLGHLYLRRWFRALVWFGLTASAVFLLVPPTTVPSGAGFVETFSAMTSSIQDLSLQNQLLLISMTALQMLDAYMLALDSDPARQQAADEESCPNCGKELDDDVSRRVTARGAVRLVARYFSMMLSSTASPKCRAVSS